MLTDWIHWLSSLAVDELLALIAPLVLLDAPRYTLAAVAICLCDMLAAALRWLKGDPRQGEYSYCPDVCVVLAGLNEADTIGATLESVWGSYPRLEIIVVDDGSSDGMSRVAREFAESHEGVLVLTRQQRGGKSSALNFALPFTKAEIVVCVDTDSHLGPGAIWEIVQPFADPRVGAVSGTVLARYAFTNLLTWVQGFEYLRTIFVGRMLTSRLDMLGIVSGAFGAFRRTAIDRVQGWDVGPGEDGDLVLRIRKSGYRVAFAPYAQCFTRLPTSWVRLFKQRRRWDWSVVTFECRKHVDLANPLSPNFRLANLAMLVDRWLYALLLIYGFWGYCAWLVFFSDYNVAYVALTTYVLYTILEGLQLLVVLCYSLDRWRDLAIGLALPLMPLYYLFLRLTTLVAVTEELLWRRSFRDSFVPEHVREATWHW
jgi:cellulose synthase/poly-beta-1,6-N-acetylglucosamine synthase-like glycosyltransferase